MDGQHIHCTTCQARLRVKNAALVGQIVACPRCGSMVMVPGSTDTGVVPPPFPPGALPSEIAPTSGISAPSGPAPSDSIHFEFDSADSDLADRPGDGEPADGIGTEAVATLGEGHPRLLGGMPALWWGYGGGGIVVAGLLGWAGWTQPWRTAQNPVHQPDQQQSSAELPATDLPADTQGETDNPLPNSASDPGAPAVDSPNPTSAEVASSPDQAPQEVSPETPPPATTPETVAANTVPAAGEPPTVASEDSPLTNPTTGPTTETPPSTASPPSPTPPADPVASSPPGDKSSPALTQYADMLSGIAPQVEAGKPGATDSPVASVDVTITTSSELAPQEKLMRNRIARRLQLEIDQLAWEGKGVVSVLHVLARLANAKLSLDPTAVLLHDIVSHPVSSQTLGSKTLDAVLKEILTPLQLGYRVEAGYLHIHALGADARGVQRVVYRIGDLTHGDEAQAKWLLELIPRCANPASWNLRTGSARIELKGDEIEVDQSPEVHWEVLRILESLRVARGLPLRSRYTVERFALGGLRQRSEAEWLKTPVTVKRRSPSDLGDVLLAVGESANVTILIDWQAVLRQEVDTESVSLYAQGVPLAQVLREILPSRLDFRILDSKLIEVTSRELVETRGELEVYVVPESLRQVPPGTLEEELGRTATQASTPGAEMSCVIADPYSPTLLVRAPRSVHRAIADWLDSSAARIASTQAK